MVASRLSTRAAFVFLFGFLASKNLWGAFQKHSISTVSNLGEATSTLQAPIRSPEIDPQQQHLQEDASHAMVTINKLIDSTIEKWSLPHTYSAKLLLKKIWEKDLPYNPETDLIVFYHPLKSGGTSVSTVLEQVGKLVPGSHASGHFNFEKCFQEQNNFTGEPQQFWEQFKVLYSHDEYRQYSHDHTRIHHFPLNTINSTEMTTQPSPPRPTTKLYRWLQHGNEKRVRHLTMVREPLALLASNMNEWICKNDKWQRKAKEQKIPPATNQTHACYGYTLQQLTEVRKASNVRECHNLTKEQLKAKPIHRRHICKNYQAMGQVDDTPYCASTSAFLEQYGYKKILNQMGYYYEPPPKQQPGLPRKEEVIEGVMEFLGGIDVNGSDDMLWFGITERMQESLCLLHYRLGIPWREMPQKRVRPCRPTTFWDEDSKHEFYERESFMTELHRAANAVLDMQLSRMKYDIQMKVGIRDDNITTTSYPFVPAMCYVTGMDG